MVVMAGLRCKHYVEPPPCAVSAVATIGRPPSSYLSTLERGAGRGEARIALKPAVV
jgi:hypothetical protein